MMTEFGLSPYRAGSYGARSSPEEALSAGALPRETRLLRDVLERLKCGSFSDTERLVPLMTHQSYDVRQYSQQLFAHVCNHQQTEYFEEALHSVSDSAEIYRGLLRLGETLSLRALPLMLSTRASFEDNEMDEYLSLGLRVVLSLEQVEELVESKFDSDYVQILQERNSSDYYYRGRPVFVGDITKELIRAALSANREQRGIVLVEQAQILSNFSGIQCPIENGEQVSDDDMKRVFDYVQQLSKISWQPGVKYFYGTPIP